MSRLCAQHAVGSRLRHTPKSVRGYPPEGDSLRGVSHSQGGALRPPLACRRAIGCKAGVTARARAWVGAVAEGSTAAAAPAGHAPRSCSSSEAWSDVVNEGPSAQLLACAGMPLKATRRWRRSALEPS